MGTSAIGRGTAIEENKVKASSGDGSPDFLDSKVDNDTMLVVANQLESVNEFFVDTFSRDTGIPTGTPQLITSVGFRPKAVIFFLSKSGSYEASWGFSDGTNADSIITTSDGGTVSEYTPSGNAIVVSEVTGVDIYVGSVNTFDASGFTLTWTRIGVPTGTVVIKFIAFK